MTFLVILSKALFTLVATKLVKARKKQGCKHGEVIMKLGRGQKMRMRVKENVKEISEKK